MPSFPSLVVAANIFFTPIISSGAPVGLACPGCYLASHDADRRSYVLAVAANAKPAASDEETARVAGDNVRVNIKEWHTPTPRSHPHDQLATSDGAIWYTGQMANLLGRLDPKTGQFREYRLKIPDSGPHGLVADANGAICFTASFEGYIGKLEPATGDVREFKLSDPSARDPRTAVFDQKGTLWFTVVGGNMLGRLDPTTGDIKLVPSPTPHSLPYGLLINSQGVPFFAEFGANKIARVDPATMAIKEFTLPNPDATPRRIAAAKDDGIWYTDYARGYLGRLDSKTDDVVWYVESAASPNMLVRFDPKSEKLERWPIPSGGGVVRNMAVTPSGNLALACSGADTIALVEITQEAN